MDNNYTVILKNILLQFRCFIPPLNGSNHHVSHAGELKCGDVNRSETAVSKRQITSILGSFNFTDTFSTFFVGSGIKMSVLV